MSKDSNDDQLKISEDVVLSAQNLNKKKPKFIDEEHTPIWIKLFGGSILSIMFLSIVTVTGYVVNNLNSLQLQLNSLNGEVITKREFNDSNKNVWDTISGQSKNLNDVLANNKERISGIEQLIKERQLLVDKIETRLSNQEKNAELINKDNAAIKERITALENQLNQCKDELRQWQRDTQKIVERITSLEAKIEK